MSNVCASALDHGIASSSSQSRAGSLSITPQNEQAFSALSICGPPQEGQCAEEIAMSTFVVAPVFRPSGSSEVITGVCSPRLGCPFPTSANCQPDQRTRTSKRSIGEPMMMPSVSTEPTAHSPNHCRWVCCLSCASRASQYCAGATLRSGFALPARWVSHHRQKRTDARSSSCSMPRG